MKSSLSNWLYLSRVWITSLLLPSCFRFEQRVLHSKFVAPGAHWLAQPMSLFFPMPGVPEARWLNSSRSGSQNLFRQVEALWRTPTSLAAGIGLANPKPLGYCDASGSQLPSKCLNMMVKSSKPDVRLSSGSLVPSPSSVKSHIFP